MTPCRAARPASWRSRSPCSSCSAACWRACRRWCCSGRCCSRSREQFGINQVQYAIVAILAMGIGLFSPPFGVGFYQSCLFVKVSSDEAFGPIWPYMATLVVALLDRRRRTVDFHRLFAFGHLSWLWRTYESRRRPAPMFYDAIRRPAGLANHDSEVDDPSAQASLDGWVDYFMQAHPDVDPISKDSPRVGLSLPNVYWTLLTKCATLVGLYTNVPEGGSVDSVQQQWVTNEFAEADENLPLIVALHHPIYSFDTYHSGSAKMADVLENTIRDTGRVPNSRVLRPRAQLPTHRAADRAEE